MNELTLQRVPFTKDADNKLRSLKAKTGLTPNILCRLAFCLSVEHSTTPPEVDMTERGREINRYTLFGEYETLFTSLLKVWHHEHSSPLEINDLCIRHIHRGISLINPNKL
ncbi:DNA sulfur modification protein DndE [Halodesulfovibrio aestuarii]|uniref:DNA sulfur modification protein DndE n=1 Tax=Halodesulfovibrio aestuarii TaxID=126333 RepID=A0A8G2C7Z1_9BACT|nr:DNA sulfur modification protein DndE [Halodesulfovibrio aestuarii]SHI72758.1 DNA sulfur modification protein DndE [Halodesulfovibrio aestuarii]